MDKAIYTKNKEGPNVFIHDDGVMEIYKVCHSCGKTTRIFFTIDDWSETLARARSFLAATFIP